MSSFPTITAKKLIKVLTQSGFILDRVRGSHHIFFHPQKQLTVSIPVHPGKDLGKGITKSILADADIDIAEFLKKL